MKLSKTTIKQNGRSGSNPARELEARELEKRLRAEAKQLAVELHAASADEWSDVQRDDYAPFDEMREMEYSHIDALNHRLRQVEEALERVTAGKFGYCSKCHRQIETRRLESDPAVALCVKCQASTEPVSHFATL